MKHPASIVIAFSAIALLAYLSVAGPLDLPVGPIAPANKPLAEVEPRTAVSAENTPGDADAVFVIDTPGSYYLTGAITAQAGDAGKALVEIASDDVTLDLNGFTLDGAGVADSGVRAGAAGSPVRRVTVSGGTVLGATSHGVSLNADDVAVIGLRAVGSGAGFVVVADAALATAPNASFVDWVASDNTGDGFIAPDNASFLRCEAISNGDATTGAGFSVGANARFTECLAVGNTGDGFVTGRASTLTRCTARGNGGDGVSVGVSSRVVGTIATENVGIGIVANGTGVTVQDCTANGNARGVSVADNARVVGTTATFNRGYGILATGVGLHVEGCTTSNNGTDQPTNGSGDGIEALQGQAVVIDTVARDNWNDGIQVNENSRVVGCTAIANQGRGIVGSNRLTVIDSMANGNGADGIRATGEGNVVKSSTADGNTNGVNLGQGARVTDSAASGNTQDGFVVGSGSHLRSCTALGNALRGIETGQSSRVEDCTANGNFGSGIVVNNFSRVTGCTANSNAAFGISVAAASTVRDCNVQANDTGIALFNNRNRVDGCTVTGNTRFGIVANDASAVDNVITDNFASGNPSGNLRLFSGNFGPETSNPADNRVPANITQ
jgi:hypothetical protein